MCILESRLPCLMGTNSGLSANVGGGAVNSVIFKDCQTLANSSGFYVGAAKSVVRGRRVGYINYSADRQMLLCGVVEKI
ncbi:hypothetical protein PHMEG_0009081 [Phytophthora megakarya]|uniref:Uncharacterized protein n=1 Tax=Phytophthora megakarya TaxID=4795 RepID=A0A225WHM7_9STRA|nr:hypothetical protein PHMEG_0009081 [Phytophthora megakarya]